jgi:hypothetical protein
LLLGEGFAVVIETGAVASAGRSTVKSFAGRVRLIGWRAIEDASICCLGVSMLQTVTDHVGDIHAAKGRTIAAKSDAHQMRCRSAAER